jgi:choline-sulfatase
MTDDHGPWAAGCYGNRELQTPNMDWLAANGVRMTRAFTPCPVCSPARACLFTGRLPSQHGIHDWLKEDSDPEMNWLAGETTLAQLLQAGGYQTGLVGKWHCGNGARPQPGFDYWFSHQVAQYPHYGEQRFVEQGHPVSYHGHQSPFLTEKALHFLRTRDRERPFFLFVGYVDTHSPFQDHPERLADRYRGGAFADIPVETPPAGPGWVRFGIPADEATRREHLAQYYAAVTGIDEQIGRIVDALDDAGELENTLLVYTSDHGHLNGHHGLYTKGNATVPQNFLEESIRVPCLLHWPGHLPRGHVEDTMVDHCDLFQTLLHAAACVPAPAFAAECRYPGRSYLPLLTAVTPLQRQEEPPPIENRKSKIENRLSWREEQYCEYGNARMIRTERYKWIHRYAPHADLYPNELYDLHADPRETVNQVDMPALAATIDALEARLEAHFRRYEAPGRSAKNILDQPSFNPAEPWRLQRDTHA